MLLAAVTRYVCFALKALKLPVFSFELTLLTFSVSYLWILSYIYIYTYVVHFTYFCEKGGRGAVNFDSLFSFINGHYLCFQ